MSRSACLLLMLLVAVVPATASAAPAKPLTPKSCGKGKVRLAKKAPCVKLKLKGAARGDVVPAKAERRVDKALGKKRAKAADKLAVQATAKVDAVKAKAAAKQVEGGQWRETTIGGRPGRERTTTVTEDGPTATTSSTVEAEVTETKDGVRLTISATKRDTFSFSMCPDEHGNVKASVEMMRADRKEVVEKDGKRLFVEERRTQRADITVKLDRNLKIADASYKGSLDVEGRGTGASMRRYVMTWNAPAPFGTRPGVDFKGAGALAGTYRGPRGDKFTTAELELLLDQRVRGQLLLEQFVRMVLEVGEKRWSEDSNCVDVTVDPKPATLAKGGSVTLNIGAKGALDGKPLAGTATVIALGGDVSPATVPVPAGGTGATTFTLKEDKATLAIEVQTTIGKGTEIVEITASRGWDVTFRGSGTYARHEESSGDHDDANASVTWETTIRDVQLSGGPSAGGGETLLRGTMHQDGTLGTGSYTCDAPLAMTTPAALRAIPNGAAFDMTISAFFGFVVPREAQTCQREGYGGTYGSIESALNVQPYDAVFTVTPELLTRDTFTVPVQRARDFPPNCGNRPSHETCTETGTMSGTVTFVKRK